MSNNSKMKVLIFSFISLAPAGFLRFDVYGWEFTPSIVLGILFSILLVAKGTVRFRREHYAVVRALFFLLVSIWVSTLMSPIGEVRSVPAVRFSIYILAGIYIFQALQARRITSTTLGVAMAAQLPVALLSVFIGYTTVDAYDRFPGDNIIASQILFS